MDLSQDEISKHLASYHLLPGKKLSMQGIWNPLFSVSKPFIFSVSKPFILFLKPVVPND